GSRRSGAVDADTDADADAEPHPGSGSSSVPSSRTSRPHVLLPRRRLHLNPGGAPDAKPIDCDLLVMASYNALGIKKCPEQPESRGYIPIGKLRKFLHLMLITRTAWRRDKLSPEEEESQRVERVVDSMVGTFAKLVRISGTPGTT